ncbi:phosphonate ABC transporter, permease protein PhnE [Fodinicurvata fenggangensis]|uniref:phosphonate ABC transporter, permease protein PhnE n=1 Tax=Fodinicurvata fenggangensis TaxID=1121830 RepID=UPI0005564388|nr:phosphonate ABC transporter, permease protein PhnE [Fodinicurvata fenggangensis]
MAFNEQNKASAEQETRSQDLLNLVSPPRADRLRRLAFWLVAAALLGYSAWASGVISLKLFTGLPKLGDAFLMMLVPSGFQHLPEFLWALMETVAMAFLGTLLAGLMAIPLALLCARTTFPIRILQFGFRRFSDSLRSLDYLIWALIFVRAIGLGPFAGILAIAVVDLGTLAKLYSEAIDNASRKPSEGVQAAGGTWLDSIRLGILPQVLPNILSATLYMWESNTRSATILGIVGAGGIGYQLADRLRVYEFGQASLMIILIIIAVASIDSLSGFLRRRLIGRQ